MSCVRQYQDHEYRNFGCPDEVTAVIAFLASD